MKGVWIVLATASMVATAAVAQPYNAPPPPGYNGGPGPGYDGPPPPGFWDGQPTDPIARLAVVRDRIRRAAASRRISPDQAHRVEWEAQQLADGLHRQYEFQHGHLNPGQIEDAQHRIDRIVHEVQWDKRLDY